MTMPRPRRELSEPIPNGPFQREEVYFVRSPQGELPVGEGLAVDPETGAISVA